MSTVVRSQPLLINTSGQKPPTATEYKAHKRTKVGGNLHWGRRHHGPDRHGLWAWER